MVIFQSLKNDHIFLAAMGQVHLLRQPLFAFSSSERLFFSRDWPYSRKKSQKIFFINYFLVHKEVKKVFFFHFY